MNKLWGGRFKNKKMDPKVFEFTSSLNVDKALAVYDCLGSKAHAEMLAKRGYITAAEKKAIVGALNSLVTKIKKGGFEFGRYEDVHSAVQAYVEKKARRAAEKMHTGRSRNEQVASDARMYVKDAAARIAGLVTALQKKLVALAERNADVIMPGYTHLGRAQGVLFSHLVLAYVEGFQRDKGRIIDAGKRCDESVLGSGALAGSSLFLDRKFVAKKLGFSRVSANSIDSVSDRDFMMELVSALSVMAVRLSRISEDFILYAAPEFGFLEIGEKYCTGSSLMPQKKNPDVLELIRGRSARVTASLNSLLMLLKGLPHSYNRDLQEDKKALFEAVEVAVSELEMMAGLVGTVKMNRERALAALENEFIYATDVAEYLVRKGVSFAEAHKAVGKLVKKCADRGINISDLSSTELKKFSPKLEEDVFGYLDPEVSVRNKKTLGSTNPAMVRREIVRWKKRLWQG